MTSSPQGVKQVNFETAAMGADWRLPYKLLVPGIDGWSDNDVVFLGMSPDAVSWDDYGIRSRVFPPQSGAYDAAPFFQANSDDGSGIVTLVDPNLIDIVVPWNTMRQMGPGGVNLGIQYRQKDTGSRAQLLIGRLPLAWGVI